MVFIVQMFLFLDKFATLKKKMDIKLQGDSTKKGLKVKVESDEIAVKLGKNTSLSNTQSNVKLKSLFEEMVTSMRNGTPLPSFPTLPRDSLSKNKPECPSFSSQHAILQSLLKLVWETHLTRYNEIVFTFEEAIQMKVENTKRICEFNNTLEKNKTLILEEVHENSILELKKEYRSLWADKLLAIQELLNSNSHDVSELLELLIAKAVDDLKVDMTSLEVDLDKSLGLFRQELLVKSDELWKQWSLQLERHSAVLKGKLTEVNQIDEKLKKNSSSTFQEITHKEKEEIPFNKEMMYKDMILLLSSMKLDFEIRLTSLSKLKEFLSIKIQESKQKAVAKLITQTLTKEEEEIEASKVKLQNQLNDIKLSQDRVLRELSLACNNSLAPVETILKSMQLTIDLNLETARERVYMEALKSLKEVSLNKFFMNQEKK
jgi:hypothetical protein